MLRNEKGGALVLTILVTAMLVILGAAFVMANTGEGLQAINHDHKTQAHYYARSGAYMGLEWLESEKGLEWLSDEDEESKELSGSIDGNLIDGKNSDAEIDISIKKIDKGGKDTIEIISTGLEVNKTDKLILSDIEVNLGKVEMPIVDMTIFAENSIKIGNNITVEGDIGTNGDAMDIHKGATVSGKIKYNLNRTYPLPNFPDNLDKKDSITINNKDSATITASGEYEVINVKNGGTLNIDLSGGDLIIRVKSSLDISGTMNLINGEDDSRLILFTDKPFEIKGDIIANSSQIVMFYSGSKELKFNGNSSLAGLIYAPFSKVTFTGSSNPKGVAIIAKEANINGATKKLGDNPLVGLAIEWISPDGTAGASIKKDSGIWSKN